jgi:preprotein translocase subunit SecA
MHARRRAVLLGGAPEPERRTTLAIIDELWSDHLVRITELREGIHWVSLAGHDPVNEFRKAVIEMFDRLLLDLEDPDARVSMEEAGLLDTSSTWTYLIDDKPMGDLAQRFFKGMWKSRR